MTNQISDNQVIELRDAIKSAGIKNASVWVEANKTAIVEFLDAKCLVSAGTKVHFDSNGVGHYNEGCGRCGGQGGLSCWPGFTCFSCGGSGTKPARVFVWSEVRQEAERIENESAGKGRHTNKDLRDMAKAEAAWQKIMIARRSAFDAAGLDWDRFDAAVCLFNKFGWDTITDDFGREQDNEHFNREIRDMTIRGMRIATDIAYNKAEKYGLSEKQAEVIGRWVVQMENAEQTIADRKAAADAINIEEGRYEFEGVVIWQGTVEQEFGYTSRIVTKVGIKLESGAVLFGTQNFTAEKGDRVRVTATVSKSQKAGTGNFKRPSKGAVVAEAA